MSPDHRSERKAVNYTIAGKNVSIVPSHEQALVAWADTRRRLDHAPLLLSFDHHTDTHRAFCCFAVNTLDDDDRERMEALIGDLVAEVDFRRPETVLRAVEKLRHDEQIDAAIRCNIVDVAFILTYQGSGTPSREQISYHQDWPLALLENRTYPERPFTYDIPRNRVFEIDTGCYAGCRKQTHDDDCIRPLSDQAIESRYLQGRMTVADEMCRSAGLGTLIENPYILDVDLDYLRTAKSVVPKNASLFYRLIRQAIAITIATSPSCVEICRLPGEEVTADYLLSKVEQHIARALRVKED